MTENSILIVEDEIIVAENIRGKLRQLGYHVPDIVVSGKAALEALMRHPVDLVLMDIQLSGAWDGIETATRIREQYDIPIIYHTAYADEDTLQRAKLTEPFGYLLKPFQIRELRSNVEMALYKHRTDRRLKASEERYRHITEAITDYIYTVSIQNGEAVHTRHSAACVAVTGYTPEEFQRNPHLWIEMVIEDDRDLVLQQAEQIVAGRDVFSIEHRIRRKNGTVCWIKNTPVLCYDHQGTLVAYDGLVQDITERRESELALQQERESLAQRIEERTCELKRVNAELARAARMKDEFLATMSHEFRTPLHTILGMAEALGEELFGPLTSKQQGAITNIEESGRHLLALIQDILDLAKIEAGRFELNITPVSVQAVCQSSLRFVKQDALKKHLGVSFSLTGEGSIFEADNRRVKQILVNLLSNAVKFTPEGGKFGLDVEIDNTRQLIHFCVWDTGIGIARKDIARLFLPFVQLDSTFTRKHSGTGLGLSLVSRMVKMHGGSIAVESEPDNGSRFMVTLPWKKSDIGSENQEAITSYISESPLSALTRPEHGNYEQPSITVPGPMILIAEDQEPNIDLLSQYFQLKGYQTVIARNGFEAIEQTRAKHPAIILMDIQMPGMDGITAIQHIRTDTDMKTIPIIALTALAMPGDKEKCLTAGADEYLSKPVNLRELCDLIQKYRDPS